MDSSPVLRAACVPQKRRTDGPTDGCLVEADGGGDLHLRELQGLRAEASCLRGGGAVFLQGWDPSRPGPATLAVLLMKLA